MTALVLRLAAPLQSWGTSSRFVRRNTDRAPSKSGIIGLLAAAQGRRRTDPIEDLVGLRIGVRIEQPGRLERDFQTARPVDGSAPMPLSYRFYLADAVFLVAVQGEPSMLAGLQHALRHPVFPLFLGRRSCPPAGPVELGLRDLDIPDVLETEPWLASLYVQKAHRGPDVRLDTVTDEPLVDQEYRSTTDHHTATRVVVRDEPISFDPRQREHGWRTVYADEVTIPNPHYHPPRPALALSSDPHNPMAALDGTT
jgi:CRISPR system Cascade subunit CasD